MKRNKHEEHENHERWLVSYADFITLLFAFFVVMYATSSKNEGKYRVASQSLLTAFSSNMGTPRSTDTVTGTRTQGVSFDVGGSSAKKKSNEKAVPPRAKMYRNPGDSSDTFNALSEKMTVMAATPNSKPPTPEQAQLQAQSQASAEALKEAAKAPQNSQALAKALQEAKKLEQIAQSQNSPEAKIAQTLAQQAQQAIKEAQTSDKPLRDAAKDLTSNLRQEQNQDKVRVKQNAQVIEVEIRDGALFDSAQAQLSADYQGILGKVAQEMIASNLSVQVEGHTDSVPIKTGQFPSNWELSGARAGAVARYLMENGIKPDQLTTVGYGETRPIEDNSTAEGRAKNRRITLKLFKTPPPGAEAAQVVR